MRTPAEKLRPPLALLLMLMADACMGAQHEHLRSLLSPTHLRHDTHLCRQAEAFCHTRVETGAALCLGQGLNRRAAHQVRPCLQKAGVQCASAGLTFCAAFCCAAVGAGCSCIGTREQGRSV